MELKDGELSGLDDFIKAQREADPDAFAPDKPAPRGVDYAAEAQRELSSTLGRGVKIVTGKKKGRIELEYYGLDDLNDLLEALALLRVEKQQKGPDL